MQTFCLFCTKKLLFLFYTPIFTKHPHQSIYSKHLFNKIFILLQFFIISSLTTPLSYRPNTTNDHPYPATIITHLTTIIKESQPIQSSQINTSTRKPTDQTMRNIGKPNHHPPETHWSNNEKQRKSEVIGEALWRSARDQWRWQSAVVARDQGLQEV